MKISKFSFLKVLARHLVKKLNDQTVPESSLVTLAQSLMPPMVPYMKMMHEKGIMDDSDVIDIEKLKEQLDSFFVTVPMINLPMRGQQASVTKKDADAFIEDLNAHSDVQDVICLPCQSY